MDNLQNCQFLLISIVSSTTWYYTVKIRRIANYKNQNWKNNIKF